MSSWDFYFTWVGQNRSLTEEEKKEVFRGLIRIRDTFGDEWLKGACRSGHPIFVYLLNQAPWSQFWLAHFGEMLEVLKKMQNFDELKQKLMDREEFDTAIAELEIAFKLRKKGLSLVFYPKINSKKPDLKVENARKETYFEITVMGTAEEEERSLGTLNALTKPFIFDYDLMIDCRIHKALSKPHLRELRDRIRKGMEKAKMEQCCVEISEPSVLDYLICPRSQIGKRNALLKQKNMRRGCEGPPFLVDKVKRLRRKLRLENKQLPQDRPGVIIIYDNRLVPQASGTTFYQTLVEQLEETVYEQENLIFGAVITSHLGNEERTVEQKPNYISVQKTFFKSVLQENVLIIKNQYSKFVADQKLINAFIQ